MVKPGVFTFYRREFRDMNGVNGFDCILNTLEIPRHRWPQIDEVTVTIEKESKLWVLYGDSTKLKP